MEEDEEKKSRIRNISTSSRPLTLNDFAYLASSDSIPGLHPNNSSCFNHALFPEPTCERDVQSSLRRKRDWQRPLQIPANDMDATNSINPYHSWIACRYCLFWLWIDIAQRRKDFPIPCKYIVSWFLSIRGEFQILVCLLQYIILFYLLDMLGF